MKRPKSIHGRWLRTAAIGLVCGAMVTFVSAWIFALVAKGKSVNVIPLGQSIPPRVEWPLPVPSDMPEAWNTKCIKDYEVSYQIIGVPVGQECIWAEVDVFNRLVATDSYPAMQTIALWGWPFKAMRSEFVTNPIGLHDYDIEVIDMQPITIEIRPPSHGKTVRLKGVPVSHPIVTNGIQVLLPVLPDWPGFACNTILYGMASLGLLHGVQRLREKLRLKAGQCATCRYQVNTLPICPECGTPVTASTRPQPARPT